MSVARADLLRRGAGQADSLLRLLRTDPTESGLPAGLEEAPLTFGPTFPFDPVTHDFAASPIAALKQPSSRPSPAVATGLARQYLPARRRGWPGRVVYIGPDVAVRFGVLVRTPAADRILPDSDPRCGSGRRSAIRVHMHRTVHPSTTSRVSIHRTVAEVFKEQGSGDFSDYSLLCALPVAQVCLGIFGHRTPDMNSAIKASPGNWL